MINFTHYLKQIVVGIDGANSREWPRARQLFSQLPQKLVLLWNDGPRGRRLCEKLDAADVNPGGAG